MTIGLLTGIVALATAVVTLSVSLRNGRRIEQVHIVVNGRMSALIERVDQLTQALEGSDTEVPIDPNAIPPAT